MNDTNPPTPRLRTVFIGCGASIYPLHEKAADPARFELIGMADRVLVLNGGRVTAELDRDQLSQENLLRHAS